MANGPKLTQQQRAVKIAALLASGVTQTEVANQLGISRSTVKRDIEDLKPTIKEAETLITEYNKQFDELYPIEQSAADYVDLARSAKNEAVRLGAQQRIDDIRGLVTDKERLRAKRDQEVQPQPMFVFNGGLSIDFGGGQGQQADTLDVVNEAEKERR
jgi:DNA-binding XRE family transcriptional regulator